jgi:hypothetical protein
MFAPTTHLQEIEQRARTQRKLDMLLVMLTALGAIGAGLAMNVLSGVGPFIGFLPV